MTNEPAEGGHDAEVTGEGTPRSRGVDVRLLELLVCPVTKSSLDYHASRQELVSRAARLAFPIRDGVPLLTVEAARPLSDDEL